MRLAMGVEEEASEEAEAGALLHAEDGAILIAIARMLERALSKG